MTALRATLTRVPGSRLAKLFSGNWDKKLLRDRQGRVFLDANPSCFIKKILPSLVDGSDFPKVPTCEQHVMDHQLDLFGLNCDDKVVEDDYEEEEEEEDDEEDEQEEKWEKSEYAPREVILSDDFPFSLRNALEYVWDALRAEEAEISADEKAFADEVAFVNMLCTGSTEDLIDLNVSGAMRITTRRGTLMLCPESALAHKFEVEAGSHESEVAVNKKSVSSWGNETVAAWVSAINGVTDEVVAEFKKNEYTGASLLKMQLEELREMGVRTLPLCRFILDEVEKLRVAEEEASVVYIEQSPASFGRILDQLRFLSVHRPGAPPIKPPVVVDKAEKKAFLQAVSFWFPGNDDFILRPHCP